MRIASNPTTTNVAANSAPAATQTPDALFALLLAAVSGDGAVQGMTSQTGDSGKTADSGNQPSASKHAQGTAQDNDQHDPSTPLATDSAVAITVPVPVIPIETASPVQIPAQIPVQPVATSSSDQTKPIADRTSGNAQDQFTMPAAVPAPAKSEPSIAPVMHDAAASQDVPSLPVQSQPETKPAPVPSAKSEDKSNQNTQSIPAASPSPAQQSVPQPISSGDQHPPVAADLRAVIQPAQLQELRAAAPGTSADKNAVDLRSSQRIDASNSSTSEPTSGLVQDPSQDPSQKVTNTRSANPVVAKLQAAGFRGIISPSDSTPQVASKPADGKNSAQSASSDDNAAPAKPEHKSSAPSMQTDPSTDATTSSSATGQHAQPETQSAPSTTSDPAAAATAASAFQPQVSVHQPAAVSSAPTASVDTTPHHASNLGTAAQGHFDADTNSIATGINASHVIRNMSESEMRVGMRSVEFGEISIRTSISEQQMTTQISADHHDLVNAISAHAPSVEAKLGNDFGLHASIEVNQSGSSLSGDPRQSQQQQQEQFNRVIAYPINREEPLLERSPLPMPPTVGEAYRLDIRA